MATRSRIGLQLADDAILSVYHHWDGYPQWLGVVLNRKFNTREKVAELLDGGDISCIDSDKDWDRQSCEHHVLYYNARGENTEPRLDLTFEDYIENEKLKNVANKLLYLSAIIIPISILFILFRLSL